MKVARFNYHHGCSLYIDDKYVCETDVEWPDEEDIPALLSFLKERGVTHIVDEEAFDDNEDVHGVWNPKAHPIDEWAKQYDLKV